MNIFMAALYTNGYMPGQVRYEKLTEHEKNILKTLPHILESWHYVGKQKYVDDMRREGAKIFLDSGAFSAFTLGVTLSVEEYCAYIARNIDIIRFEDGDMMASVLDGIGDAQQTWRNQLEMEDRLKNEFGLNVRPLPCFHFEEDPRYLDWYVERYEYITLGGMVGATTDQLRNWLDRVWENHLLDGAGRAKIKVHGFGITAIPLMEEYDWFSCDSSSWLQSAAFGSVIMPGVSANNPAMLISVSEKSPSRHTAGQHATTFTPPEVEYIFSVMEKHGFNYERLSKVYESRAIYNLWAFGEVNKLMDKCRRSNYLSGKKQDLFGRLQ